MIQEMEWKDRGLDLLKLLVSLFEVKSYKNNGKLAFSLRTSIYNVFLYERRVRMTLGMQETLRQLLCFVFID